MPCAPPGRGRTAAKGTLPFDVDASPGLEGRPRGHSLRMTLRRRLRNARGFQDPPRKVPRHSSNAHPRRFPRTGRTAANNNLPIQNPRALPQCWVEQRRRTPDPSVSNNAESMS